MKKLLPILIVSLFFLFSPQAVRAEEATNNISKRGCIDIKAAYEEVNVTSKAITGEEKSLDSLKKAESLATVTNLISLFLGDSVFCVNDEQAALKSNTFESQGLIGLFDNGNRAIVSMFPSVNIGSHLAQEFVPGYNGNNSAQAGWFDDVKNKIMGWFMDDSDADKTDDEIREQVAQELTPTDIPNGFDYLKLLRVDALWSETRNIAYLFFVIIMVIAGFMIMFRKNLPGQVVVSVGNALPRIIVSLILVTFSFAIVGIMLDLGKMGMNVVNSIFIQAEGNLGIANPTGVDISGVTRLSDTALYYMDENKSTKGSEDIPESVKRGEEIVENNDGIGKTKAVSGELTWALLLSFLIQGGRQADVVKLPVLEAILDVALAGWQYYTLARAVRLILFLLIALYASIRLFITMLVTYFKIIMGVVTAPLQLAIGAIPGNEHMIMKWFKSMAANILVFVAIIAILGFFKFLSHAIDPSKFNFFGNQGVFFPEWLITIKGIMIVGSYLFAAGAPAIVNGFMGVEQNKTISSVGESAKRSMTKIPLVGSMFNG